jgi:hypothetical protein
MGLRCRREIAPGTVVFVEGEPGGVSGYATVRHCKREGPEYMVGLELGESFHTAPADPSDGFVDYYEFLQISPTAEAATIARVYKFVANRDRESRYSIWNNACRSLASVWISPVGT